MMKQFTCLAIVSLLAGCSTPGNDFATYLSQIKTVQTPVKFWTMGFTGRMPQNNPDTALFKKFKYIYADGVYGKIFDNDTTVGIIYIVHGDALTPVLVTYSKKGERIDSLNLFSNATGYGEEKETFVSVTLNTNRLIKEIDSTYTWALNKTGDNRVAGSGKLATGTITYVVNSNGRITTAKY